MHSRRHFGVLVALLAAHLALAQESHYAVPAASVEEQFTAYQQSLRDAAAAVLAATGEPAARKPEPRPAAAAPGDDRQLQRFARLYWNGEEQNVRRAVGRVTQLRSTLDPIFAEEHLPGETAAVALVESGGRAAALSAQGARGLWQLMPETARRYGLAVSDTRDERLDVVKSTRAAARYLRQLHARFGDWRLALAAYNAGEAAVEQAAARAGARDFSRLRDFLPRETRNYVPAVLQAMPLFGSDTKGLGSDARRGPLLYATASAAADSAASLPSQ